MLIYMDLISFMILYKLYSNSNFIDWITNPSTSKSDVNLYYTIAYPHDLNQNIKLAFLKIETSQLICC